MPNPTPSPTRLPSPSPSPSHRQPRIRCSVQHPRAPPMIRWKRARGEGRAELTERGIAEGVEVLMLMLLVEMVGGLLGIIAEGVGAGWGREGVVC